MESHVRETAAGKSTAGEERKVRKDKAKIDTKNNNVVSFVDLTCTSLYIHNLFLVQKTYTEMRTRRYIKAGL